MTKEHVLAVVVLLAVLLTLGGVYQFYFKQQVQAHSENLTQKSKMQERLDNLGKTFHNTQPDKIVSAWRAKIQPWRDAVQQRSTYFATENYEVEPVPENAIPKFYYEEQYNKLYNQLQQDAYTRRPPCPIPANTFGTPHPDSFRGGSMTAAEARKHLSRLNYGNAMTRVLINANAYQINAVELWPERKEYGKLLKLQTVGYDFMMTMRDLVAFLDSLRKENRYVTIDAISIKNRNLLTPTEPVLEIQLLFTQASFVQEQAAKPEGAPGAPGAPASLASMSSPDAIFQMFNFGPGGGSATAKKESPWKRRWKWFKKVFLPF